MTLSAPRVQVFWLQTRTLFGDVRIRPDTHEGLPASLEQCDEGACAMLATQRASAGVIELTEGGAVCQWHSDLEFQPLGGPPDIGRLKLESQHQARYSLPAALSVTMPGHCMGRSKCPA